MKKLTLEFLREGPLIPYLEDHPEDAPALALLKWSKENRGYLFAEAEYDSPCALCFRHRSFGLNGVSHCNDCPLKPCDNALLRKMAKARKDYDFDKFNELADKFYDIIREKLEAQNE